MKWPTGGTNDHYKMDKYIQNQLQNAIMWFYFQKDLLILILFIHIHPPINFFFFFNVMWSNVLKKKRQTSLGIAFPFSILTLTFQFIKKKKKV